MSIYKNIVFDLDGTLIDSFGDIKESLEKAYLAVDASYDVLVKRSHIGPPVREMIKTIMPNLSKTAVDRVFKKFRTLYDNSDYPGTKMYEGARELLRDLKAAGRRLFLITNKPGPAVKKILGIFRLNYFDDVITPDLFIGSKNLSKNGMIAGLIDKKSLNKERSVVVGDAAPDIKAAKDNDIISIGVLYGYSGKKDIIKARPDFMAKDIKSLRRILLSN